MTTRPDVRERRTKERIAKASVDRKQRARNAALLLEAAALEDRAASLTRSMAALDEERTRLLCRAAVMRQQAQEGRDGKDADQ